MIVCRQITTIKMIIIHGKCKHYTQTYKHWTSFQCHFCIMYSWLDNLSQIDCDTGNQQYNPDTLRRRSPEDLVQIIQKLQQESVATGRLFIESKAHAQRVTTIPAIRPFSEYIALLNKVHVIEPFLHSFLQKLINSKQKLQLVSRRRKSLKPCIWTSCKG